MGWTEPCGCRIREWEHPSYCAKHQPVDPRDAELARLRARLAQVNDNLTAELAKHVRSIARAEAAEAQVERLADAIRKAQSAVIQDAALIVRLGDVSTRQNAKEAIDRESVIRAVLRMRDAVDAAKAALSPTPAGDPTACKTHGIVDHMCSGPARPWDKPAPPEREEPK